MQILQILVHHFENFMKCDFQQKLYSKDLYQNKDILKFSLKSINIYTWFCETREVTNFSWYDIMKNDDVTILQSAQLEHIS